MASLPNRWRQSVAGWLYAVALRLASKARCQAARRPQLARLELAADELPAVDREPRRDARAPLAGLDGKRSAQFAYSLAHAAQAEVPIL